MNYSKIHFKQRHEPIERAVNLIRHNLRLIGADHLDSTDPKELGTRGLVEVCARWLRGDGALATFVHAVKKRQDELAGVWTPGQGNTMPTGTGRATGQGRGYSGAAGQ